MVIPDPLLHDNVTLSADTGSYDHLLRGGGSQPEMGKAEGESREWVEGRDPKYSCSLIL